MGKLDEALVYYNKSMANHRSADILAKKTDLERLIKKKREEEYFSVELSDQEREKGNALFKEGKFPDSVTCYTEAIKRNPKDARNYTNRAASYLKLNAPSEALSDAEKAIELDPKSAKGYLRKANALLRMQKTTDAFLALDQASQHDTGSHFFVSSLFFLVSLSTSRGQVGQRDRSGAPRCHGSVVGRHDGRRH